MSMLHDNVDDSEEEVEEDCSQADQLAAVVLFGVFAL